MYFETWTSQERKRESDSKRMMNTTNSSFDAMNTILIQYYKQIVLRYIIVIMQSPNDEMQQENPNAATGNPSVRDDSPTRTVRSPPSSVFSLWKEVGIELDEMQTGELLQ